LNKEAITQKCGRRARFRSKGLELGGLSQRGGVGENSTNKDKTATGKPRGASLTGRGG